MALIGEMKYLTIGSKTYQIPVPESGSSVEFTPNLTSGTKVGDLTIDDSTVSLYAPTNTDEKLKTTAVTSGTTYYPIVGTNSTTAANKNYDSTGFSYAGTNGTANGTNGNALLTLGNNTASTSANWKKGTLRLYGTSSSYTDIISAVTTTARTITLPNATGTVALTSDIPDVSGKIDTAGTGLSKSGTTLNHKNSITAQTTQAVYPIKIDAQGHISAYGSAVTIPTVPTNVSAFTNDAGYITSYTDAKVRQVNDTTTDGSFPILLGYQIGDMTTTEQAFKSYPNLTYNPSSKALQTGGTINGYSLGAACAKAVDSSISSGSSSINLPTTAAVASYVNSVIPTNISDFTNDVGYITSAAQIIRW